MQFWSSNLRANFKDVQEANSSFSQTGFKWCGNVLAMSSLWQEAPFHSCIEQPHSIDWHPTLIFPTLFKIIFFVFEDNVAVITIIINGRRPNMRHVSGSHRVGLDRLFQRERANKNFNMSIRFVNTKQHIADILTQCSVTLVVDVPSGDDVTLV